MWVEAEALATITEAKVQSFFVEEHCLQVRHTKDDHIRQWEANRQPGIPFLLIRTQNPKSVIVIWAPTS